MVSLDAMGSDKEKELIWHHRYKIFTSLYKGREDVIAEHRNGEYVPVEGEGLTFERFLDHVQLKKTFAVYNKDDAGKVNFGLFDVDVFPRDKGWEPILPALEGKKRDTLLIMRTLEEMGVERRNLLIEFPTVGYHLLIFFDQPVSARALKKVMGLVLQRSGLEQIPFYPRKVDDTPWGTVYNCRYASISILPVALISCLIWNRSIPSIIAISQTSACWIKSCP